MSLIYLDSQATTPLDPRVLSRMLPYLTIDFANAHSNHRLGRQISKTIETARSQVASAINAQANEVVFTSGATESNNMALKGVCHFYGDTKPSLAISRIEHKCVLEAGRKLEAEGFRLHWIDVDETGQIRLDQLKDILKQHFNPDEEQSSLALVSVMTANNEIGTIQPIREIGQLCRDHGTLFHTDAAQAFGKIPLDVNKDNIDLMSISGHKIYGPKGIGALYVRRERGRRVHLEPLLSGGGQEGGLRSGTLPVFLVVGLGAAAEIAQQDMKKDAIHYKNLFDIAHEKLTSLPEVRINGPMPDDISSSQPFSKKRLLSNLNASFFGVEGESLLLGLDDKVCLSSGSACTSSSLEPSHVLFALGLDPELAHTAVRIGFSRFTTEDEVSQACDMLTKKINELRDLSPIWDMKKKGIDLKSVEWRHD